MALRLHAWRSFALALLSPVAAAAADPLVRSDRDRQLAIVAEEARQTIAVIDWFYVQHRACPQPSREAEFAALQTGLGDGFSVERQGQFVAIRGISMSSTWLYYTSAAHPDRCTLWRKLGWDPALIWRRRSGGGKWTIDPGDGRAERSLSFER